MPRFITGAFFIERISFGPNRKSALTFSSRIDPGNSFTLLASPNFVSECACLCFVAHFIPKTVSHFSECA